MVAADAIDDEYLRVKATDFISRNFDKVTSTEGWKKMVQSAGTGPH